MPSLIQRFNRARNSSGGDDPPPRPKTSAEELTTAADATPATEPPLKVSGAQTDGNISKAAADCEDDADAGATEDRQTTDPDQVTIAEGGSAGDSVEQQAVDPVAAAAAAAELRKASQKAKAAAALKKMKARSGFSLWNWLPTFYDPVEDTVRSRIIAVLAVAVIPAMLTGLLLEPMITDVADVTQNRVILLSPLFMPMDPMYVGVPSAKGYEFRFVVRNSKYWPQPGKPTIANTLITTSISFLLFPALYAQVSPYPRPYAPTRQSSAPSCCGSCLLVTPPASAQRTARWPAYAPLPWTAILQLRMPKASLCLTS
jgi:hypothetical protein